MDIEDIHKLGKQKCFCPYYLNRMRAEVADIILMPYNYVADNRIRDRLKIQLEGDILIFDEAHNISQVIEEASSFRFDDETFRRILGEVG